MHAAAEIILLRVAHVHVASCTAPTAKRKGMSEQYAWGEYRAEIEYEKDNANEKIIEMTPDVLKQIKDISPVPPPTRRRLSVDSPPTTFQFSSVRSNFITDSLFAGNIYIGNNAEDKAEEIVTDSLVCIVYIMYVCIYTNCSRG